MIGLADVLSFSRGGYLGVLAGTAAAVVTLLRSLGAWKKLIVVGAVLTVLVFLFFPGLPMGNRLWASFDLSEGSNIGRIETWKTAVTVISTAPLHGVGLGGYPIAVDPSAGYREPIYAHSIYLDIWAESGIFALIFWVLALGVVVVRTVQRPSPLLLALTTALLVHAVHSLVETPLYSVHILALLLVLFSLYDAVWTRNIDMRESKK
jgi:O-antigen ligase